MVKQFNVEGICFAEEHYMVNLDSRIVEIRKLIAEGKYFTINKARQYGKTTTLSLLKESLDDAYAVFSISFEGIGDKAYQDENSFCRLFCGLLYDAIYYKEVMGLSEEIEIECRRMSEDNSHTVGLREVSNFITKICQETKKPVVLIIDEVDQASDQKIFLDFLGMLRAKYLKRNSRVTFDSVILASVYDIKNLKQKIRTDEKHQYNSLWNIAADFTVDMNFSKKDIKGMLSEYEKDCQWGINPNESADLIYDFTSGYPYLVSRICKIVDERLIQNEKWNPKEALKSVIYQKGDEDKKQFVKNGKLNMDLVLERFVIHFTEIYGDDNCKFLEENGRRLFLLYLKPIINGTGNYYVEAQTRDRKRTDIIVDYSGEQYIIELKIWRGEEYNQRGEKQLLEYLDFYGIDRGYMISFNFNKNKKTGVHEICFGNKSILEAVV